MMKDADNEAPYHVVLCSPLLLPSSSFCEYKFDLLLSIANIRRIHLEKRL
jgi:hypothetical protein